MVGKMRDGGGSPDAGLVKYGLGHGDVSTSAGVKSQGQGWMYWSIHRGAKRR